MRNKTIQQKFLDKIDKLDGPNGCWLWTGLTIPKGYGRFWLNRKGVYAHRYSYEHFVGKIPKGLFVCHHCDNPPCVNPKHLFVGTNSENLQDSIRKNSLFKTAPCGEKNGFSRLTELEVRQIRKLYIRNIVGYRKLGRRFGVSNNAISCVIRRHTWKHI